MHLRGSLVLWWLLFLHANCAPVNSAQAPVVDLGYAKYQGKALNAGVNEYLGIRFAAPPLGDLRWRAPQDPPQESNKAPQDATQFRAICVGSAGSALSETTQEDCLFINIFAPANATPESNLPVWFFIQGGGFAGDEDANFNGTEVVRQSNNSIIFVNFNYRVGAFGFLASEKIRQDGDLNVGLLDQRKALEWVQQYIKQFGGNPKHVVIHGDSAGAGSVVTHLTAYGGRDDGLFVGAISESPFFPTLRTVKESEFEFQRFASNLSCANNAEDALQCLRSKDTATLQSADVVSRFPGTNGKPDWYFLPVIDGGLSPDHLYRLLEQGQLVKVPLIVGDDTNEGATFSPNASTNNEFLEFIRSNYPHLSDSDLGRINKSYPLTAPLPHHAAWYPPAAAAYGESTFTCPGLEISSSLADHFSPDSVWNYHYDVLDWDNVQQGLGVPHVSELQAVFGPGNAKQCDDCSYETYNAPVVPIIMDYWISFIKTLDPNRYGNPAAPSWEPLGPGRRLRFQTNATAMEVIPSDQKDRCAMWKSLAPTTEQ